MPRKRRLSAGGYCYHVINRVNPGVDLFPERADYAAFERLIKRANERTPMRTLCRTLMPNHFHMVLWPYTEGDMSRWMHWLLSIHARRHHLARGSYGRIWQGRFKAFPIQQDRHLLTVVRYVERNPLRAGLVERAEDWPWSTLSTLAAGRTEEGLVEGPVPRFDGWVEFVNEPQTEAELDSVRNCVNRERPFGDEVWTRRTARDLGLEFTLRSPGHPKADGFFEL